MIELKFPTHRLDETNVFSLQVNNIPRICQLEIDHWQPGDGVIWAAHIGFTVSSKIGSGMACTQLGDMPDVRDGDFVIIDGRMYQTHVIGLFTDMAIFEPVD